MIVRVCFALIFSMTGLLGLVTMLDVSPARAKEASLAQPQTLDTPFSIQASTAPTFPTISLISPAQGVTLATTTPIFDWVDATDPEGGPITYTLLITGSMPFSGPITTTTVATITTITSVYTWPTSLSTGTYSWTVQAEDSAGNQSGYVSPYTFTLGTLLFSYLPIVVGGNSGCPVASTASFDLIPREGAASDRPDRLHGDLNLGLRDHNLTTATLGLVDYNGATDGNAPQLAGLFGPSRLPTIDAVYQVNGWDWNCGTNGCQSTAITNPEVTLASFATTKGELIYIPDRNPEIYGGGYKAVVLYAEEKRITLGYTREDSVANGYAVHIEDVCVDPNLLALYQAQVDANGWRTSTNLPALKADQALGVAAGTTMKVVIRDRGAFMDPRSRKDWWQGY